jgi:glycosyltransferase involved in cell wall biosynthesis
MEGNSAMDGEKSLKVCLYNPGMHALGGGEKDICVMAEAIAKAGHEVEILVTYMVPKKVLEKRFNLDLSSIEINTVPYSPEISIKFLQNSYLAKLSLNFINDLRNYRFTKKYDVFIHTTNTLPIPSYAKYNILRILFPFEKERIDTDAKGKYKKIFSKVYSSIMKKLSSGRLESYNIFLCISEYTAKWVRKYWGVPTKILFPPVEMFNSMKKENWILSVGRFFAGDHNKKHLEMMQAFKDIYDEGFTDWEYHLVGSSHYQHHKYLELVKKEASGYPIYLHVDIKFSQIKDFYGRSKLFWHGTGLDEDPELHPERFEHFGITTGEAMSANCVPVVFNGGGQPEIVDHGVTGFLWNNISELKDFSIKLMQNPEKIEQLGDKAHLKSKKFSRKTFQGEILKIINGL